VHLFDEDTFVCIRHEDDDELVAALEAAGFHQDDDVLDTWFSSALWPLSTLGWPRPEQFPETGGLVDTFNPSSVLCTARDIITLWVSRMVMFNRYFRDGLLPFRHVYIHPMIQDGYGQRMSKSLGNGVDPRDIVHSHGADALRFTLCRIATTTQDVRLPVDMMCPHCDSTFHPREMVSPAGYHVAAPEQQCHRCGKDIASGYGAASGAVIPDGQRPLARNTSAKFDEGRNFANKLWNAARFALQNLTDAEGGPGDDAGGVDDLALVDRWIIGRLHGTLHAIEDALADYQFNVYADAMYEFVWGDFCDWYLEAIKPTVRSSPGQQRVLAAVLDSILRLLHPICPFVTETLWPHVQAAGRPGLPGIELPPADLLAAAAWPDIACQVEDRAAVETFQQVQRLVEAIRAVRGSHGVPSRRRIRLLASPAVATLAGQAPEVVKVLGGLDAIEPLPDGRPEDAIPMAFEGEDCLLGGLADAVDVGSERKRLEKLVQAKERATDGFRRKLENPGYLAKAPAAVVEETRSRLAEAESQLAAARTALERITGH
jgi:valyl-tRNA synthetase